MDRRWKVRDTRTGEEFWVPSGRHMLIEVEKDAPRGPSEESIAFTPFKVVHDDRVPEGEIWLRDHSGRVVAVVEDVAGQIQQGNFELGGK